MPKTGRLTARRMTAALAGLGVALSSVLVGTTPAHAAVIVVTTTDDGGPGSLRDALAQAQATAADDQITFDPSVTGTILLTSGELDVAVGGSSGNLTVEGPGDDVLVVDAGGQNRVLDVHGPGGDTRPTAVVSGLTLTNGISSGWTQPGGALRSAGTDLTLERVAVTASRAEAGGGVFVDDGSLLVTASTIAGNDAESSGGGIGLEGDASSGHALAIHDSVIRDNAAAFYGGLSDASGGGIGVWGSAPVTVTGSTVIGNSAVGTMTGQDVYSIVGDGGGISARHLDVIDSRIIGNVAGRSGGGLSTSSITITGSAIADNRAGGNGASGAGGGIYVDHPAEDGLRMESSTVTGNRAGVGGGIYLGTDRPVQVRLSTIAGNLGVVGGGMYSPAEIELQGTIVASNAGGDLVGNGSATLTHSLVQDSREFAYVDGGGSIIGKDPLLGALADHGGPTETMQPASNSPVIDSGSAFGHTTDQRGFPRPVGDADTPDAEDGSDIGAFELTQDELAGLPQVANTAPPTVTGRPRVGETLHTDGGGWAAEDVSLSYQWLRNGVAIPGATSASYTLSPDDYGRLWYAVPPYKRVSVRVTASHAGHRDASVFSDFTDPVHKGLLSVSRPARVIGKLKVGATLTAMPRMRAISPRPLDVYVAWFLDGQLVDDARSEQRLRLKPRMHGQRVKVKFYYEQPWGYLPLSQVVRRPGRVR